MVNQKGGCGKTTTAINTAAAFAMLGRRVLLIDLDPQAHTTIGLGYDPDAQVRTIYDVFIRPGISLSQGVIHTNVSLLDLSPCNVLLASVELELAGVAGKELTLARGLQTVRDKYDIVVIDCPPSLGVLTLNALVTSTDVLVPVQVHYYALEGLKRLLETIRIIRERFHPLSVENIGLLLTFVEDRTIFSRQIQQQMREIFDGRVFNTVIHRNARITEAPSAGESVLTYAPGSRGAAEYKALAAEILDTTSPSDELSPTGQLRRGLQKVLSDIFAGVWIPPSQSEHPAGTPEKTQGNEQHLEGT